MNGKPVISPIRIILVDNHRLMAEGVDALLSKAADITITGLFRSGRQAVNALKDGLIADLIISDLWLENSLNGVQMLVHLQNEGFSVPVLILSVDEQPDSIRMALHAGARGYMPKDCSSAELLKAIYRLVREDETYVYPRLLTMLMTKTGSLKSLPGELPVLTKREFEVLFLIVSEYENQEIAGKLFVSVGTVETHRKNLMKKLKVRNVVALANLANRFGLMGNSLLGSETG